MQSRIGSYHCTRSQTRSCRLGTPSPPSPCVLESVRIGTAHLSAIGPKPARRARPDEGGIDRRAGGIHINLDDPRESSVICCSRSFAVQRVICCSDRCCSPRYGIQMSTLLFEPFHGLQELPAYQTLSLCTALLARRARKVDVGRRPKPKAQATEDNTTRYQHARHTQHDSRECPTSRYSGYHPVVPAVYRRALYFTHYELVLSTFMLCKDTARIFREFQSKHSEMSTRLEAYAGWRKICNTAQNDESVDWSNLGSYLECKSLPRELLLQWIGRAMTGWK